MKFFEYLAADLPVVATELPALEEYRAAAAIVSRTDFESSVEAAINGERASPERCREAIGRNTYAERTKRMLSVSCAAHSGRHSVRFQMMLGASVARWRLRWPTTISLSGWC